MLDCQQLTLTLVTAAPQGPAQVPNLTQGKEREKLSRIHLTKLCFRRYKTQLRDFLSSCRTKRKANDIYAERSSFPGYPSPAATAYMTSGTLTGYPATDTTLYMQQTANIAATPAAAAYQTLYPGVDNRLFFIFFCSFILFTYQIFRYLAATDYFAATAGYRTALAGTYYPTEYHAALGNGYLDVSTAGSRISSLASYDQVRMIKF